MDSYTRFMKMLNNKHNCLIVGGCELSLKYGYLKSNNIKFINLPNTKHSLVDFHTDISQLTGLEIKSILNMRFDIIVFEHLPFDAIPDFLEKLQYILIPGGKVVFKGFDLNAIHSKLECCNMYDKLIITKKFILTGFENYQIVNFTS